MGGWKCEVECYSRSREDPGFHALANLIPRYYAHDPAWYVLVVELVQDAESLADRHQRLEGFSTEVAATLGRALSLYHSTIATSMRNGSRPPVFPGKIPWIFSFHDIGVDMSGAIGA